MEYLLKMVDLANKKLGRTTSYGTGSYATKQAADAAAANKAVNLIRPVTPRMNAVTYFNDKFVAVGENIAAYSTDGIHWIRTTLTGNWTAICTGKSMNLYDNRVVAVGNNCCAVSTDGITWTTSAISGPCTGIAGVDTYYGPAPLYTTTTYNVVRSDGVVLYGVPGDWTTISLSGAWTAVASYSITSPKKWQIVSVGAYGEAAYSTDAVTWSSSRNVNSYKVAYGDDKFVAASYLNISYTEDYGATWKQTPTPGLQWGAVVYGAGKFIVLSIAYLSTTGCFVYGTDGVNWSDPVDLPGYWLSAAYGGGKFVAVGNDTHAYSTDGLDWSYAA
jgi:hypothetical protein